MASTEEDSDGFPNDRPEKKKCHFFLTNAPSMT